ncbi:putative nucleosome binding protein [Purpureocillium lavendulum]|uniref:Nucleosome binding protein n=1 Tax=Purpureocillium lavendulum TaxID=1247861 RepID=A0AB34G8S7_9HYPO|nr:putative nucleosome binding protein [Purpureocillium lavendulum]
MTPYITSGFSSHSLIPITSQMAFIILGLVSLAVSRLIDLWGLAEGFGLTVVVTIFGLLLMMLCQNVAMYTAAIVTYEIGYGGILYTLLVFVTDKAQLKYRPMAIALTKVPYIATTFAGPRAAQAFYSRGLVKWAFGSFMIILSGIADFDVIGIVVACVGVTIFLLPFNLAATGLDGWKSASTISMITVGFVLLGLLVLYECYLAPKTFLPFELLRDRVVWGACLSVCGIQISSFCWLSYFTSQLQVVHNMTIGEAGYLANTSYVGTGVAAILTGVSQSALNGIIACQVLISLSSGIHAVSAYIGVLDGASPSTLSMRLALAYLSSMIGASIALAISGALWTNLFPARLSSNLVGLGLSPEEETQIYSSLIVQLSYGLGTPVRTAIIRSYGQIFRIIMSAATALSGVSWIGAMMMRDINASERDAKDQEAESEHDQGSRGCPVPLGNTAMSSEK